VLRSFKDYSSGFSAAINLGGFHCGLFRNDSILYSLVKGRSKPRTAPNSSGALSISSYQLKRRANGERPLDFLVKNWTNGTATLVEPMLQKWAIDPLARWVANSWADDTQSKVRTLLAEQDKDKRETLFNKVYSAFEKYERKESVSVLELVLWKAKLNCGCTSRGRDAKRQALDTENCRLMCGAEVIIPNVTAFLG